MLGLIVAALVSASAASAADTGAEFTLTIRDHKFEPAELTVPAGQKVTLTIKNEDSTPEEFESKKLKREKVVTGNGSITVNIGPLKAGEYPFYGEYHEDTAKGKVIAK